MAHFRKVDVRIWNDAKFMALSERAQLIFLFILTHPSLTSIGAMRGTVQGVASELFSRNRHTDGLLKGFEEPYREGYAKAFSELLENGMVKVDDTACFVWLPKFLKYNPPENGNVVKAWVKAYDLLPDCALKAQLFQYFTRFAEPLPEWYLKAFTKAFDKVIGNGMANPMPIQEQEQEQYKYPLLTNVSKGSDGAPKTNGAVFIELPLKNGNTYPVPVHDVESWTQDFLLIDLRHELRMMKAWLEANPKKGKTKAGMPRFIVGWFQRASKEFPKRKLGPPEKKDLRAGRAANDDGSYKL